MSGETDPAVLPCAAGASRAEAAATEARPVDDAAHRDCRIRLVSVKEKQNPDSDEYIGSAHEIFPKILDLMPTQLAIQYEVVGCAMDVTLWLELEPGNTVHANFYRTYEGSGVTGPRVVTIVNGESRAPGTHEVLWDMRDKTQHHRLMLSGQYQLKIQGLHDVTRSDQSTVKFAAPFAYNHGIHYHKRGNNNQLIPQTTKRECEHAADRQQHLPDGTTYSPEASMSSDADIAWSNMRQGAISVISGHSNPNMLIFYPAESEPGRAAVIRASRQSAIHQADASTSTIAAHANSVNVLSEPADALRDMLLAIMAGCKGGNEAKNVQDRLRFLHQHLNPRGIDGDHGPRTTAALATFQDWWGLATTDGTQTPEALAALGVDPTLADDPRTRAVQTRLRDLARRYDPGAANGVWNDRTERALTHWQEDHPPLDANSLPDEPTLASLRLDGENGHASLNMADLFRDRGCNLVLGFVKSVSFRAAETWHIHFWDLAAQGTGVEDACAQARDLCPTRMRRELDYSLYNRADVDRNQPLHPARYGADI